MPLNEAKKQAIRDRALPMLITREARVRKEALAARMSDLDAAKAAKAAAFAAYDADPSGDGLQDAAKAAAKACDDASAVAQAAGRELHRLGEPEALIDLVLENLDDLTGNPDTFADTLERTELDAEIAADEAKTAAKKAKRQALG